MAGNRVVNFQSPTPASPPWHGLRPVRSSAWSAAPLWLSGKARTLAAGQSPAMRGLAGDRRAAWEPSGASRGPGPRADALRAAPPPLTPPWPESRGHGRQGAVVSPGPVLSTLPAPPQAPCWVLKALQPSLVF